MAYKPGFVLENEDVDLYLGGRFHVSLSGVNILFSACSAAVF